jgi:hypothetical protein
MAWRGWNPVNRRLLPLLALACLAAVSMPSPPGPKAPAKGAPRLQALALASVEPSARAVALSNAIWTVCHEADTNLSVTVMSNDYRGCYMRPMPFAPFVIPDGYQDATNVVLLESTNLSLPTSNWLAVATNHGARIWETNADFSVSNDWSRERFYRLRLSR